MREEFVIEPNNIKTSLIDVVKNLTESGLILPMITEPFDLLTPDHSLTVLLLSAIDSADVRLIKLGYFNFHLYKQDYWKEVNYIRGIFEEQCKLSVKYHVIPISIKKRD